LYALRDITGTVEAIPLIASSIMSKKIAEGTAALVLDVKFGTGAFMQAFDDAVALAESLVGVANGAGLLTSALLTDMNRCLGTTAGNAVEVRECLAILRGDPGDARLVDVTVALAAEMLVAGGLAPDLPAAAGRLRATLADGSAADRFARMVHGLGGPPDLMDRPDAHLAAAPVVRDVHPTVAGTVTAVDTRALGLAVVTLGGGRTRPTDPVDPAVGLTDVVGPGDDVAPGGRPLARVHARTDGEAEAAANAVRAAMTTGGAPASTCPLVARRIGPTR
jgi:thymidine phosphorylase